MMQKSFEARGLAFSYITEADLPEMSAMLAKESVCTHVFFGPNSEEETCAYFRPYADATEAALGADGLPADHVFVIRRDGEFIGHCALVTNPFTLGNYTVGYFIDEPHWGQGYGDTACKFLIEYAFGTLGAYRLTGDCEDGNAGSRRIMERNGFRFEGCQRNHWPKGGGEYRDNQLFGLLRNEN